MMMIYSLGWPEVTVNPPKIITQALLTTLEDVKPKLNRFIFSIQSLVMTMMMVMMMMVMRIFC